MRLSQLAIVSAAALALAMGNAFAQQSPGDQISNGFSQAAHGFVDAVKGAFEGAKNGIHNATAPSNGGGASSSATASSATAPSQTTRYIQNELGRLGYYHGGMDGRAGPKTEEAIRRYQQDKGLAVDGKATQELWTYMQSQSKQGDGGQPYVPPAAAPVSAPPAAAPMGGGQPSAAPNSAQPDSSDDHGGHKQCPAPPGQTGQWLC